jgi:hypothetical protein
VGAGREVAEVGACVVKPEPVSVARPPGLQESPGKPLAVLDIVKALEAIPGALSVA